MPFPWRISRALTAPKPRGLAWVAVRLQYQKLSRPRKGAGVLPSWSWWAVQDLNLQPTGYEPAALTD